MQELPQGDRLFEMQIDTGMGLRAQVGSAQAGWIVMLHHCCCALTAVDIYSWVDSDAGIINSLSF